MIEKAQYSFSVQEKVFIYGSPNILLTWTFPMMCEYLAVDIFTTKDSNVSTSGIINVKEQQICEILHIPIFDWFAVSSFAPSDT